MKYTGLTRKNVWGWNLHVSMKEKILFYFTFGNAVHKLQVVFIINYGVFRCLLQWNLNVTNTPIEIQFFYVLTSCCKSIQRCILCIDTQVRSRWQYFCSCLWPYYVCDKCIYMYSTYWYTITLPWKFYVVSEHVILYWMCCRNIFVLIKIIF